MEFTDTQPRDQAAISCGLFFPPTWSRAWPTPYPCQLGRTSRRRSWPSERLTLAHSYNGRRGMARPAEALHFWAFVLSFCA